MVNLPDLTKPNYQNFEGDLNAVEVNEVTPLHMVPSFESSTEYSFPPLPEPQMDFPLFPEPSDPNLFGVLENKKCSEYACSQKLGTELPALGLEGSSQSKSPNGFFEDIPTEIFEYFEHIPISPEQ